MPSSLTRFFYSLLLCLWLPAQAQAESLTLVFDTSVQVTPLTASATPTSASQKGTENITLYPNAYSNRNGLDEKIYNFDKKTFTVVNHAEKTYTVYPLHAISITRARERINRINTKVAMYQQHAESMQISLDVLSEDVDIDMMLGGQKGQKTARKILAEKTAEKNTYKNIGTKNTLAVTEPSAEKIPDALRKSYAHFVVYDLTVHPMIKEDLAASGNAFKSIYFINRDMFKNISASYTWTLKEARQGQGDSPVIPAEYRRAYHQTAVIDQAFKEALTPIAFDDAAFQAENLKLVDQSRYLEAFLTAQIHILSMSKKEADAHHVALQSAIKVGQNFERATYLAMTQTPGNPAELKQYIEILENAKKRAGEYVWLLDYYIAQHTYNVARKKANPNKFEIEQMATANNTILNTLPHMPRLTPVYQHAGDVYLAANDVPNAMLYWAQLAEIAPDAAGARALAKMKADAEKNFPEYF